MKLKKPFKKEKVVEVVKTKYPKVLDEIDFDIRIGVTHAENKYTLGYLEGETSMLEKVKKALS